MGGEKIKLYGYWRSSCSWRVRIALELKGIDYEYIPVNLLKGENKSEEYAKLNPRCLVPTLVVDDLVLSESLAIIEYLDEKYQTFPLLPIDPYDKAIVRSLAYTIASNTQPIQNMLVLNFVNEKFGYDKAEWARHWISKGFDSLEKALEKVAGKYCFGDQITLADLTLVPQVYNANRFGVDMEKYPIIKRINENLQKIDAFIKSDPENQIDAILQ